MGAFAPLAFAQQNSGEWCQTVFLYGWMTFIRRNNETFSWYVCCRYIGYDYETGSGVNRQPYDLQQHGPTIGFALSL